MNRSHLLLSLLLSACAGQVLPSPEVESEPPFTLMCPDASYRACSWCDQEERDDWACIEAHCRCECEYFTELGLPLPRDCEAR